MIPPKAIDKLKQRITLLGEWCYAKVADVPLEAAETMEHLRVPPGIKNGAALAFKPAPVGSRWGQEWGTVWFRGEIRIPSEFTDRRVYYRMDSFADKLLFVNAKPFSGMNPWHREVLLTAAATGRERFTLHIDQYTGHRKPTRGKRLLSCWKQANCLSSGRPLHRCITAPMFCFRRPLRSMRTRCGAHVSSTN